MTPVVPETYGPLVRRAAHWGGALFVLGSVQFLLGMALTQLYYPNYSLLNNYVSDLGGPHSPAAWIFNDSIRVLGALGVLGAILIRTAFTPKTSARLGILFLVIASVGAFLVGTYPEQSPELGGNIHVLVSAITFIGAGFALLFLAVAMLRDTRWAGFRGYTGISGLVTLVALVLFQTGVYGALGPGGMERVIIAPILLWAIVAGSHLLGLKTYAPGVPS